MRYSFRSIIESLPVKKNSNSSWWVKLWVRKVSFLFTFFFINLGFSSNAVSILSIFITLAACICYAIPTRACLISAVILINFWLVLDCVDGNIARCKKQKTVYGEFVDDIGGYFTVAFIYLAVGICAYHNGGILVNENNQWILIAGAISSSCDLLARLIHKDYCNFSKTIEKPITVEKVEENRRSLSFIRRRIGKELGISGLFMLFTIVGAVFNAYDLITCFYLLFNGFALISTAVIYIYRADKYDKKCS